MKTIAFVPLMLALCCTALVAQMRIPVLPKPSQILFDFRPDRQSTPHRISAATQRSVLSKVFRKYLTDESRCNRQFDASSSTDYLKAARNAGQIVPAIVDVANGSFTAAGLVQTAYVISVSECNASHAENYGSKRVAIFAGQQLVADLDVDYRSTILRKTDLNGDGIDELLMTTDDMHQGTLTEMAALISFANGRLRVVEDFGMVTEDSCASEMPGSSSRASVLTIIPNAVPGKMPRVKQDNYGAGCRKGKRWRFLSTGKMPD
jgi:hypothetical protein